MGASTAQLRKGQVSTLAIVGIIIFLVLLLAPITYKAYTSGWFLPVDTKQTAKLYENLFGQCLRQALTCSIYSQGLNAGQFSRGDLAGQHVFAEQAVQFIETAFPFCLQNYSTNFYGLQVFNLGSRSSIDFFDDKTRLSMGKRSFIQQDDVKVYLPFSDAEIPTTPFQALALANSADLHDARSLLSTNLTIATFQAAPDIYLIIDPTTEIETGKPYLFLFER
ncbi:hypothetical protein HYS47_00750 [Candidatus Woesearchaeota archaeon]|nr:hypothetical protein [Candidatus Woesearchaeota archaeon]